MDGRPFRVRPVVAWATVAAVWLTVGGGNPSASSASDVPLHVLLTLSSNLTSLTRQTLISEAERIWRHEQVRIEWAHPGQALEHPSAPLRVLVVARPPRDETASRQWPVAELIPEAEPRALAIASIAGAERVVDEATRSGAVDGRMPRDRRLGLVLGRAVAHEIGHFLLATSTHADSGLMRASIDAREFAAVDGAAFRLDPDASRWLRERLTASAALTARAEGFSYARHRIDRPVVFGGASSP